MREIEFRGKYSHNGEWVFGSLLEINGNYHIVSETDMDEDGHHIRQDSDRPTWVNPDTIGQFTGLLDKNGKKIYEGDIVRHPYIDPIFRDLVEAGDGVTSEVVFHDGAFVIKYDEDDFIYLDGFTRHGHVEVVGNIHEKK